jgi:restriction system protein
MVRRGFLAELHHQSQIATRERERAQRIAVQEHDAADRRTEHAQKAARLAAKQLAAATEVERKALEKEAHEAHIATMEAEAEERNHRLAEVDREIDSISAVDLQADNYVDLNTLRVVEQHPSFNRPELESRIPEPDAIPGPPQPIFTAPEPALSKKRESTFVRLRPDGSS